MADLYVHDQDFDPALEALTAKGMFGIAEKPVPVQDWKGLATTIRKQPRYGQVVFSFHGFDGGLLIDSNAKALDEKAVKDLFTPAGAKAPAIETIRFMGCNVGNRPTSMLAFADIFGATRVSGYTWYLVKQAFAITFPKGSDEATIKKTLDPFAPYSAGALPAAKVLAATKTRHGAHKLQLVAYYGSADGSAASTLPIPFSEGKGRKPWTRAEQVQVKPAEADTLEREIQGSPVMPFQLVTVAR